MSRICLVIYLKVMVCLKKISMLGKLAINCGLSKPSLADKNLNDTLSNHRSDKMLS